MSTTTPASTSFVPSLALPTVPVTMPRLPADAPTPVAPPMATSRVDLGSLLLATPSFDQGMRIAMTKIFKRLGWTEGTPLVAKLAGNRVVVSCARRPASEAGSSDVAVPVQVDGAGRLALPARLRTVLEAANGAQVHALADVKAGTVTLMSARAAMTRLLVA